MTTIGGPIVNIIMKSEKARLMTNRFDGVRSVLVFMKMYRTHRLPSKAMTKKRPMVKPSSD